VRDVSIMTRLTTDQTRAFASTAVAFLLSEDKGTPLRALAATVKSRPEQIQKTVSGLANILLESAKARLSLASFRRAIHTLSLNTEQSAVLHEVLEQHSQDICHSAEMTGMPIPHYSHIDWRLEVEIASRTSRNSAAPKFSLRLDLDEPGQSQAIPMECSQSTLLHVQKQLEAALSEESSVHSKRFQRYIS